MYVQVLVDDGQIKPPGKSSFCLSVCRTREIMQETVKWQGRRNSKFPLFSELNLQPVEKLSFSPGPT